MDTSQCRKPPHLKKISSHTICKTLHKKFFISLSLKLIVWLKIPSKMMVNSESCNVPGEPITWNVVYQTLQFSSLVLNTSLLSLITDKIVVLTDAPIHSMEFVSSAAQWVIVDDITTSEWDVSIVIRFLSRSPIQDHDDQKLYKHHYDRFWYYTYISCFIKSKTLAVPWSFSTKICCLACFNIHLESGTILTRIQPSLQKIAPMDDTEWIQITLQHQLCAQTVDMYVYQYGNWRK